MLDSCLHFGCLFQYVRIIANINPRAPKQCEHLLMWNSLKLCSFDNVKIYLRLETGEMCSLATTSNLTICWLSNISSLPQQYGTIKMSLPLHQYKWTSTFCCTNGVPLYVKASIYSPSWSRSHCNHQPYWGPAETLFHRIEVWLRCPLCLRSTLFCFKGSI